MNEKIELTGVPETMLQTLYARAKESRTRGAIRDKKAEEVLSGLNYDFTLADSDAAMHSGVIARTIVLDRLTAAWLAENPGGVVINIACGLDTRCYRMQGYAHWYNLDLPETIAVRQRLLPEEGVITQLAFSAMDDWGGEIAQTDAPVLIVMEGLTMYLSEADVQRIFAVIAHRFARATVFVEVMNPLMVRHFKEKSIEGSHAAFTWGIKNGRLLAEKLPGFTYVEEHSLAEGMAEFVPIYRFLKKLPAVRNISNRIIVLSTEKAVRRALKMSFWENTRKPTGTGGRVMVSMMNVGHRALADWGLSFLETADDAAVLDCGCGGGANLTRLLKKCPNGRATGIDYSPVSVEKSREVNRQAIADGRCEVLLASVTALPFADAQFSLVTAFETVYFWPDLAQSFREVYRVLQPGGTFFICNEGGGDAKKDEKWLQLIDGMTIYTPADLKSALEQAGFGAVQLHRNEKGWLCAAARK